MCVKRARTELCGGSGATRFPTAIEIQEREVVSEILLDQLDLPPRLVPLVSLDDARYLASVDRPVARQ